jgi:hypothetical protein
MFVYGDVAGAQSSLLRLERTSQISSCTPAPKRSGRLGNDNASYTAASVSTNTIKVISTAAHCDNASCSRVRQDLIRSTPQMLQSAVTLSTGRLSLTSTSV